MKAVDERIRELRETYPRLFENASDKDMVSYVKGLDSGLYELKHCPVCGEWWLGSAAICEQCGLDAEEAFYDRKTGEEITIEDLQKAYQEKLKQDPDYRWIVVARKKQEKFEKNRTWISKLYSRVYYAFDPIRWRLASASYSIKTWFRKWADTEKGGSEQN